jgi:hypothetical protein
MKLYLSTQNFRPKKMLTITEIIGAIVLKNEPIANIVIENAKKNPMSKKYVSLNFSGLRENQGFLRLYRHCLNTF